MEDIKISAVVALDTRRGIGKDNLVPWHIREDLIRLKRLTIGHVVILGRTTYESMLAYYAKSGKPTMSQRTHIVVTRNSDYKVDMDKGFAVTSMEEAIERAKEIEKKRVEGVILNAPVIPAKAGIQPFDSGQDRDGSPIGSGMTKRGESSDPHNDAIPEIFVIGGGEIFRQAMPYLTRLYLTVVQKDFECDTFFPDYSDFTKVIEKEEHPENDPPYTFLTLER